LVQDVDKFLPEVANLIDCFDFVPGWRIDDVMVSFATDQGGVGPHTDAYDVFLMQTAGRRRWRVSERQYTDEDLLPDLEQRILSHFDTDQEWVLEPGDILYLPPGIAHWGTAEGDCMTYSLGFRAPSQQDLAADWFQHLVSIGDKKRLADPNDLRSDSPAELTAGVRDQAVQLLNSLPTTASEEFQLWLGRFLTDPKPQFHIEPPEKTWHMIDLADWLATRSGGLSRHPYARLAWTHASENGVILFYQGESLRQPQNRLETIRLVAENRRIGCNRITQALNSTPAAAQLLLKLINEGILEPVGTVS
jgi:50S ribosomal protein L16 3-hydroxylase